VNNTYHPEHGYKGAMPNRGEKADPARRVDKAHFNGNEERDGRGHETEAKRQSAIQRGSGVGVCARTPAPPLTRDIVEKPMTLGTILLIVLVLLLIGAIPRWSHSRNWGYGPSGGLGLVLVVVVVLLFMGRL
jgi:hypothetical protein